MIPLLADVPVVIDRDAARAAAEAELAGPDYQAGKPSLLDRVMRWLGERFMDLLDALGGAVPGGATGLLVLLALIVAVVVAIRLRVGGLTRQSARTRTVYGTGAVRSAAQYRQAAERAFTRGDPGLAVRERFRALVRALEERGVLDERSGRTADEAATDAGDALPGLGADLATGAALFGAVHYGGHPATDADYRALAALDERCQVARPVPAGPAR